jgi:glycosyltransferase involved in cell wall biosynthesis
MGRDVAEPTLTVFLPNYNHAHFLPEALKSLEQQTYQPLEIIIVDDSSTDNSVARRHKSVRFIRNEVNRGVVFNENRAIELAAGSHFFGMSADDRIRPRLLAESMALLAEHPQAGFCSALSDRIDESGRNQGSTQHRLSPIVPVTFRRQMYLPRCAATARGLWVTRQFGNGKRCLIPASILRN